MQQLWSDLAARAGLSLGEDQHKRLEMYLDLLTEANERMNLTRIVDRPAARVQHVGDSLTVLPFLPAGPHRLADVGSGGGVPGIPLAIARLDASIVLIEATQKKAEFLKSAVHTLNLRNVTVIAARAEDVGNSPERETFDIALARAVATLDWLAEWCLPLVKKHGHMLAMKGPKVQTEIPDSTKAIKMLGGAPPEVIPVSLPGAENLVIVKIEKIGKTDARFPRPASIAKGRRL